jgi:hypothetical protein
MENTDLTPKRKKRKPTAWLYENGEKKRFVYVKTTDRLSAAGIWMRDHPTSGGLTKEELRAILK